MNTRLLFLHALSPLHAGTGQGVGVIDLPIAREKATNIPFVPGSTIKGVLRDASQAAGQANTDKVFGPPTDNAADYSGSLVISDARLLLLPVRSLLGTFAWVTSPYLLHRLGRDLEGGLPAPVPSLGNDEQACYVAEKGSELLDQGKTTVYLEDLDLTATPSANVTAWATWLGQQLFSGADAEHWRKQLTDRLCIVHDNVLAFLLDTATEVRARVKLDDKTKTVQSGGLWYEEALPAETVLAALAAAAPVRVHGDKLTAADIFAQVETLVARPQQIGGKATVGYGVCNLRLSAAQ
jgi:CRISPR-associated protein Cmr4